MNQPNHLLSFFNNLVCRFSIKLISLFLIFIASVTQAQVKRITAPGNFAFSTNFSFGEEQNTKHCSNDSCTRYTQNFFVRNDNGSLLYLLRKNEAGIVDTFYANWYNENGDIIKAEQKVNNILYSTLYTYSSDYKLLLVTHLKIDDTISIERYTYSEQGDLSKVIGIYHAYNPKHIALQKTYTYLENGVWQEIEIRYSGYKNEVARKTLKRYDQKDRILLDWLDEDGNGEFEKQSSYVYNGDLTIEYKYPYRVITYKGLPMSYSKKKSVYKANDDYSKGYKRIFIDSIYTIIGANHFDTTATLPSSIDLTSIYLSYNQASKNTYYNARGLITMTVIIPSDELGGPIENREEISECIYDSTWQLQEIVTKSIFPVYKVLDDYEVDIVTDTDEAGEYESDALGEGDVDADYHMYDYSDFTIDTLVTGHEQFVYDIHGNLTEKFTCELDNLCQGFLYEYDSLNRLIKRSHWTGAKENRVYDSWVHLYVYDEDGFLKEKLEGEKEGTMYSLKYDANGNTTEGSGRRTYFGNQQFKHEMGAGLAHTLEVEIPKNGLWQFDLYDANFACIMRLSADKKGNSSILQPIENDSKKTNSPTYQLSKGKYYLHLVGVDYEDRGIYRLRINNL